MSDGKEIISIHVGQWGIDLGTNFWKGLLSEHGIDNSGRSNSASDLQLESRGVYFNNTKVDCYIPRAIVTDLEPITRKRFNENTVHELLPGQNKIYGQSGCYNNWAKGFYSADAGEVTEKALDALRCEAEQCDSLQGIQMTHSIFAGTGGGMGSLLLSRLTEEYPEIHQMTSSVMPTYSVDDGCVIRPYNTVLSLQYLAEHADLTWLFSHWAMNNKIVYQLKMDNSWALYNRIISDIMSGATTSLRFPTEQGSDLTRFIMNLAPTSPRLHFLTSAMAPVYTSQAHTNPVKMTTTQLARELCQDRMWTMSCNQPRSHVHGRCLAYSAIFRGPNASANDIGQFFQNARYRTSPDFVEWMPANAHLHVSPVSAAGYYSETAAFGIGNFTSVIEELEDTLQMFDALFKRKSFLHFYTDHGMDQMEFVDAASIMTDLIEEYKMAESDTITQ
ncbi:Tubulin/FtsZ, GTPase domain-containing protein [Aspergillus pseudodeflectus]|uniref:Tubulin/FtsZ, GTPase domain-containing protein n=1 Tax=Aspergillus pseudodeflectus TaxID=176178 RepID=A0ABR4JRI1_9EURO